MRTLATAAALVLAACGGGSSSDRHDPDPCARETGGAPWLAFVSHRSGNYDIWVARADGTCPAQVTDDPAADLFPTWYATTIAFASERGGAAGLWAHDLGTGLESPIDTGELASATSPAFSPDGSSLAFEGRAEGAARPSVYLVPAAGGTPSPLETVPGDGAGPAWAPDGQTVYFVSVRSGGYEIWSVPGAGGDATQVTSRSGIVGKPAVGADGALVYARTVSGTSETEVVRREPGTGSISVVPGQDDSEPALSADGQRLAVRSFRGGPADVVVERPDGSEPVFVTSDPASDGAPTFLRTP